MSVAQTTAADITILKVDGDLAGSNAEELKSIGRECLQDGRRDFVIDLGDAPKCDSAGLESLTWLQRECADRLGLVKLCGLSEIFKKILDITKLTHRFASYEDTF